MIRRGPDLVRTPGFYYFVPEGTPVYPGPHGFAYPNWSENASEIEEGSWFDRSYAWYNGKRKPRQPDCTPRFLHVQAFFSGPPFFPSVFFYADFSAPVDMLSPTTWRAVYDGYGTTSASTWHFETSGTAGPPGLVGGNNYRLNFSAHDTFAGLPAVVFNVNKTAFPGPPANINMIETEPSPNYPFLWTCFATIQNSP